MTDASAADTRPKGALARLLQRKLALFGLVLIAVITGSALLAP